MQEEELAKQLDQELINKECENKVAKYNMMQGPKPQVELPIFDVPPPNPIINEHFPS